MITRFTAEVDPAALGRPMQALIAVQLGPQSAQVVSRFLDAVTDDPCVLDATVLSEVDFAAHPWRAIRPDAPGCRSA